MYCIYCCKRVPQRALRALRTLSCAFALLRRAVPARSSGSQPTGWNGHVIKEHPSLRQNSLGRKANHLKMPLLPRPSGMLDPDTPDSLFLPVPTGRQAGHSQVWQFAKSTLEWLVFQPQLLWLNPATGIDLYCCLDSSVHWMLCARTWKRSEAHSEPDQISNLSGTLLWSNTSQLLVHGRGPVDSAQCDSVGSQWILMRACRSPKSNWNRLTTRYQSPINRFWQVEWLGISWHCTSYVTNPSWCSYRGLNFLQYGIHKGLLSVGYPPNETIWACVYICIHAETLTYHSNMCRIDMNRLSKEMFTHLWVSVLTNSFFNLLGWYASSTLQVTVLWSNM